MTLAEHDDATHTTVYSGRLIRIEIHPTRGLVFSLYNEVIDPHHPTWDMFYPNIRYDNSHTPTLIQTLFSWFYKQVTLIEYDDQTRPDEFSYTADDGQRQVILITRQFTL